MRMLFRTGILACLSVFLLNASVWAKRIAIPPLTDRIATADCIVVGKVTAIEDKAVKLPDGGEAPLAVVKIETGLLGAKGLTHIKVAAGPRGVMAGQEACLFLNKVKGESFYTTGNFFSILRKDEPNFEAQLDVIKRCAAALEDPVKALKAKDAHDRFLAAAVLVGKHRPWGFASEKFESIDAEQSKLILQALIDADWKKFDNVARINAQQVFFRIAPRPEDGWKPTNFQNLEQEAKTWLKANLDTFRVKRMVLDQK